MPNSLLRRAPKIESRTSFSVTARQGWQTIAASLLVHGLVVSTFIITSSSREPDAIAQAGVQQVAPRQVTMIYIPEQPPPAPSPPLEEPPRRQPPAPDAIPAEENRASRGTRQSDDAPAAESAAPEPEPSPVPEPVEPEMETAIAEESTAEAAVPTMESEARRIFGRPESRPRSSVAGPLPGPRLGIASAAELARQYEAERSDCRMQPRPPRDPGEPIELGVATGRVFRPDRRTPVAGAFLQVLGTQWSAFTDGNGVYRLEFDASLVDHCRTQTVRITANGYQMRDLILGIGYGADDVILHRF